MKKLVCSLGLLVACLLFFAACDNSRDPAPAAGSTGSTTTPAAPAASPSAATPAAGAARPFEITFWTALTGKNAEALQELVDKYNSSQDKIRVQAVSQGNYWENGTKLQAALVSDTYPVMTMLEVSQVGEFGLRGALADLAPYFTAVERARFVDGLVKQGVMDGKFVAVPYNRSTPILFYNKDMLRAAGLDESGPKTWDELRSFSQKISDPPRNIYGFECPVDIWFIQAGIFQQNGSVFTSDMRRTAFQLEAGVKLVAFWQDMVKEGSMKAPLGQDYNSWDVAMDDLVTQKVAMIFSSTADLTGLIEATDGHFALAAAFLPAGEKRASPTGGAFLTVFDKSSDEQKAAAVDFIKFLTRADNDAQFSKATGYLPVVKDALDEPVLKELYARHPQYQVAYDQLQYTQDIPPIVGFREMSIIIQEELKAAMVDTSVTPRQALDNAARQVQNLIK
ncbi:MAG: ABC transporter substrate-binding protein [Deltaproteobacteria bacterium]|jgi:sn-glycerol 3-phosphate transport system substrate-binding protein|nr:ABC transporter substrate-binding protein [Deltaproteobacteria bacterium]